MGVSKLKKTSHKFEKISCLQMEIALSGFLNYRTNLIVPNIHRSFFQHELDLCVLSPAGYCTEIEIKVDKYDLIKDKEKPHGHRDPKIKFLYFAIPDYLMSEIEHIPERAGIIKVFRSTWSSTGLWAEKVRQPQKNTANYKFSEKERLELMRLQCMRVWGLKEKLSKSISLKH